MLNPFSKLKAVENSWPTVSNSMPQTAQTSNPFSALKQVTDNWPSSSQPQQSKGSFDLVEKLKPLAQKLQEIKSTFTRDDSTISQFFRPENVQESVQDFRQIPGIKQVSNVAQSLKPESDEEAQK